MAHGRRQFTREFKLEAVRLLTESGRPLAQVAREVGVRPDMLRRWREAVEGRAGLGDVEVFPGPGRLAGAEEELRRLRRENESLRQDNEILKKAAAFFARTLK